MLPSVSSRNLGKLAPDPFHVDAVPCMSTLHTKSFKMAAGLHTGVRHLSTSDVLELHRTPMLYGVKRAHGLGQNLLVALRGGGLHRPSRADTYHSTHAAKPEGQSNLPQRKLIRLRLHRSMEFGASMPLDCQVCHENTEHRLTYTPAVRADPWVKPV